MLSFHEGDFVNFLCHSLPRFSRLVCCGAWSDLIAFSRYSKFASHSAAVIVTDARCSGTSQIVSSSTAKDTR